MKYYKTGGYKQLIEEVEVVRETQSSVWVKRKNHRNRIVEERQARKSNYTQYWKEKKEAVSFLMKKYESSLKAIESDLVYIRGKIKELKSYNESDL